MGCAVGMGSPMHACMCSPSVLLACMARLPPAPPLCLNDWFPDPRSAGRAVAWPSRPRRPLGVCETQNSTERPKAQHPCAQGHRQSTLHTTKHQGEGHKGEAIQPATQLQRGANLLSQAPPNPPWEHWHIGTLAHWHQSLLACRSLLSVPPCQIIQAATSAGRQAANKQTSRSLVSVPALRPGAKPRSSKPDRQTDPSFGQPASKPDGKWELAG